MSRTPKLYSREFLGVRLVRLEGKPRKALQVVFDYYAAALLPSSNMTTLAISCEDVFLPRFERSIWHRVRVASLLGSLGAIPVAEAKAYVAKQNADRKRKDAENASANVDDSFQTLGLTLTRQQKAKIKRQLQDA